MTTRMEGVSVNELAAELLEKAREVSAGRSARTVHGGHQNALRQTVIALAQGEALADHESPGEATLHVLSGRVRLSVGEQVWEGGPGDLVEIPPERHRLDAVEESAVLLTVVVTPAP